MNCREMEDQVESQYYSESTGETLTLLKDPAQNPPIEDQVAWVGAHPDAVLVYYAEAAR